MATWGQGDFGFHAAQCRWRIHPKKKYIEGPKPVRLPEMSCAKFPGADMEEVHKSLKMQHEAQRLRALAPDYDRVRRDFNCGLANEMEREARGREVGRG